MAELDNYLSILFKFLAASLVLERVLEYADELLDFFGFAGGNKEMLLRLAGTETADTADKEPRRVVTKMLIMQTCGFVVGIILCYASKLGIAQQLGFVKMVAGQSPLWWDLFLSGALISGGAEPIHNLINFLKYRKDQMTLANQQEVEKQRPLALVDAEKNLTPDI